MKFPATIPELMDAGYRPAPTGHAGKLCACGETFIWWISPAGKWMPFSAADNERIIPHHITCKNRADFKVANDKHKKRTEKPKPKQEKLF